MYSEPKRAYPTGDVVNRSHGLWRCSFRLTVAVLMLDIETEWTLNASSTRLSSYEKCSKRRILGHSAQTTSLLQIDGTTRYSRIARGFGCGRGMAFAAEVSLLRSHWAKLKARFRSHPQRKGPFTPIAGRAAYSGAIDLRTWLPVAFPPSS
jgi:hypothetical protein